MSVPAAAQAELTPTGKLRVGINFGNELLTVPNTLGVEYNAHVLKSILKFVAPALGWR